LRPDGVDVLSGTWTRSGCGGRRILAELLNRQAADFAPNYPPVLSGQSGLFPAGTVPEATPWRASTEDAAELPAYLASWLTPPRTVDESSSGIGSCVGECGRGSVVV
jgi:hypothetical protein